MHRGTYRLSLTLLILISLLKLGSGIEIEKEGGRKAKVFSLFSIVQFKNAGCKSQSAMVSGQSTLRNGTCYTNTECSAKGGSASGNCAAGFGVCCLFLVSSTGSKINQNNTYIRNPGFPSPLTTTSGLSYTVEKCSKDICYLRLDFETFTILGPTSTSEVTTATPGGTCPDQFKVTTNTGQNIPIICGSNAGQHMYIDIGVDGGDTVILAFSFSSTIPSTNRMWEINASQISCYSTTRPPNGCLQYFTTPAGRITTFNFAPATSAKLDSQLYNICIRQSAGFCCVQYLQCQNVPNSFTIDTTINRQSGAIDSLCTADYITIPGSSTSCTLNGKLNTRYCGSYLGLLAQSGSTAGVVGGVCDCGSLFMVGIRTDTISQGNLPSSGVCLDYNQVPC